jgi:hypothetical protein
MLQTEEELRLNKEISDALNLKGNLINIIGSLKIRIQRAEAAARDPETDPRLRPIADSLSLAELQARLATRERELQAVDARLVSLNEQQALLQSQIDGKTTQQNNTQSAGQQVAQSGDAGVTNPSQPTQTFTSPDAATTTATQPDPVVAVSNSNIPAIGASSSPSSDAAATTTQTNAEEAVDQTGALPEQFSTATRGPAQQSYVFYATEITSEFRQGRFEQTLEGCLYIFPRPKTSQVADPPVRAADLGSQSFGLTPNNTTPRVNTTTRKVSSAQDVRKATIASQTFPLKDAGGTPTNTRVTAQDNTPDSRFFGF